MKTTDIEPEKRTLLYEEIADKISISIDEGTFKSGDRIPSIRNLSLQMQVSVNTVREAYALLEDRRVIEARPQSGYYVSARLPDIPNEPDFKKKEFSAKEFSVSELVLQVMRDAHNPELIQFGAAVPDLELLPIAKLTRMLFTESRKHPAESVSYAIPPGCKYLRSQISKHMINAGCMLRPDEIVTTNGGTEAIYLALNAVCKPGDTVVVESPTYFSFLQMLQDLKLRPLEIPVSCVDGISLDALRYVLESTTVNACLVITNFNNPVGVSIPDPKKRELVKLLEQYDVPLIEDDVNGDLSFKDQRPTVAKSYDTTGNILLCSSFSKTLAPGYRVGWIAPGRYQAKVERFKMVSNVASPSPVQLAIAEFLANGGYDHHLRSIRRAYAKKVAFMAEAVGHHFPEGTRITRPEGGNTLWVELPEYVDTVNFYDSAIKNGITIAPGTIFSTTKKFSHYIRLNAAYWFDKNEWAVETLGRIIKGLKR
ncbi:PLP-dependent aminotransferase family protein [bacterium]|nr:PLP-dependent aminotransferase family protein [bacterium]